MENKNIKINNKSDKPDNIVLRDHEIIEKCLAYENKLPTFMKDYFIYLKGSVAVSGVFQVVKKSADTFTAG